MSNQNYKSKIIFFCNFQKNNYFKKILFITPYQKMAKKTLKFSILFIVLLFSIIWIQKNIVSSGNINNGNTLLHPSGSRNNQNWINQSFWNWGPNDVDIITALFGYVEDNIYHPSVYTQEWRTSDLDLEQPDQNICRLDFTLEYALEEDWSIENINTNGATINLTNPDWYDGKSRIIILWNNVSYAKIIGSLNSSMNGQTCTALISKRPWWSTLLSDNWAVIKIDGWANFILENVNIDGSYKSPTTTRTPWAWIQIQVDHLVWEIKNATFNNITISNAKPAIDAASLLNGNILLNNITTYNNQVKVYTNVSWIFFIKWCNIVINNLKSFDNVNSNDNVIYVYDSCFNNTRATVSLNNSYFNPWINDCDITFHRWYNGGWYSNLRGVINNVVGNICVTGGNVWRFLTHDIIWNDNWDEHYWYFSPFNSQQYSRWRIYWYEYSGIYRDTPTTSGVWCLTWNYIVNPITWWTYTWFNKAKYNRLNSNITSTTWCVNRSKWATITEYLGSVPLKYSYWKGIPTQQQPVKLLDANDNVVPLNIPYNNNYYIASQSSKTTQSFTSYPNPLRPGNAYATVSSANYYSKYSLFWPYINPIIDRINGAYSNIVFTPFSQWTHQIGIIAQVSNTHFNNIVTYNNTENPTPTDPDCHFSTHDLTIQECTATNSWTPMYNYSVDPPGTPHGTPFRLSWYGNWNRVNYNEVQINYTAPRTAGTTTYIWECRYATNNWQWFGVTEHWENINVTVNNAPVTANNTNVYNVWCWTGINWKTLTNAQEWQCWSSDLTASVILNGNFWSCSVNWDILTYVTNAGSTNTDSCRIRISDNEGSYKEVMISRYNPNCTVNSALVIDTWAEFTNNPLLFVVLYNSWNLEARYKQLACVNEPRAWLSNLTWTSWVWFLYPWLFSYGTNLDLTLRQWWCNPTEWLKTVRARINNDNNNILSSQIILDTTSPDVNADEWDWFITLTISDNLAWLSWWQILQHKRVNGNSICTDEWYLGGSESSYLHWAQSTSIQISTNNKEWQWTLCVKDWFYDRAGNPSEWKRFLFNFQEGWVSKIRWTLTINNGAEFTNNPTVSIRARVATTTNTVTHMQFSCDNQNRDSRRTYSETPFNMNISSFCSATVSPRKTVYVQFKDNTNYVWWNANDHITLDQTKPVVQITSVSSFGWHVSISDTISWLSGTQQILKYRWQQNVPTCPTTENNYSDTHLFTYNEWELSTTTTIPAPIFQWTYYLCIYSWVYDRAGNSSDMTWYNEPIVVPPSWLSWTIQINGWDPATNSKNFNLSLTSNANYMQFSCSQYWPWTTRVSFTGNYTFILGSNYWCNTSNETKTIYVKYIKNSENIIRSDSIIYDTNKPTISATTWDNAVTVTIYDSPAWLQGWQSIKYLRSESSTCPSTWYSTQNLSYSAWQTSVPTSIASPWNGLHRYLCIDSGIQDRAWNISDRTMAWQFCFNCWWGAWTTWCRWSMQPTLTPVWEINKNWEWLVAFSCNGIRRAFTSMGPGDDIEIPWLNCDDHQSFLKHNNKVNINGCQLSLELGNWTNPMNQVATMTFSYNIVESNAINTDYEDTGTIFTLTWEGWAERYLSGHVDSDPVRFDFEWPTTTITDFVEEDNPNWSQITIGIRDIDNRSEDLSCYYSVNNWYQIIQNERACNQKIFIDNQECFNIDIRAVDDLWNTWNIASSGWCGWNIPWTIWQTIIYSWTHTNTDDQEYYKWQIILRAMHNNSLGIAACEYTLDGWNTWHSATKWNWYCETSPITPNQDITANFRILNSNNDTTTGQSLYAIYDWTAPNFVRSPEFTCTWNNRCNQEQEQQFIFYEDEWVWLESIIPLSCTIEQEWIWVSCTVTWVNVCDRLWNCFTDDLTSYVINIDKTAPIWFFENANTWCNSMQNDTWFIVSWYDNISWLPTEYLYWRWTSTQSNGRTGENIIPINENDIIDIWIRDKAGNTSIFSGWIDNSSPNILNQNQEWEWYECDSINAYIQALDEWCGNWELLASFNWWPFKTWRTVSYQNFLTFDFVDTSSQMTGRVIPYIVKDSVWNQATWNLNLTWKNVPLQWNDFELNLAFWWGQNNHLTAEWNRREKSNASAWECETVTVTNIECNDWTWSINWDIFSYISNNTHITLWWREYCTLELYDWDTTKEITVTLSVCSNWCAPTLTPEIIWWSKFINRCYTNWVQWNWTFINDPFCGQYPQTKPSNTVTKKFSSWNIIEINLNGHSDVPLYKYRVSCIEDDTYCSRLEERWNDIWCDDIRYTLYILWVFPYTSPTLSEMSQKNCRNFRNSITDNKGWLKCAKSEKARSEWKDYPSNGIIERDLLNWSGCNSNWGLWIPKSWERTVRIQIQNRNLQESEKEQTEIVFYDNTKPQATNTTNNERTINSNTISASININKWNLSYWIFTDLNKTRLKEPLLLRLYETYLKGYTDHKIDKNITNNRFVKYDTCKTLKTERWNFNSIINNSCICLNWYCGSWRIADFEWLTTRVPAIDYWCRKISSYNVSDIPETEKDKDKNYVCNTNNTRRECVQQVLFRCKQYETFYDDCTYYSCILYDQWENKQFECEYDQCLDYWWCLEYEKKTVNTTEYESWCLCDETNDTLYISKNNVEKDRCSKVSLIPNNCTCENTWLVTVENVPSNNETIKNITWYSSVIQGYINSWYKCNFSGWKNNNTPIYTCTKYWKTYYTTKGYTCSEISAWNYTCRWNDCLTETCLWFQDIHYECYTCTSYLCTKQTNKCIQWGNNIDQFIFDLKNYTYPAYLYLRKRQTNNFDTSLVNLYINNKELTWYTVNLQSQNQSNWPNNADVKINIDLPNTVCECTNNWTVNRSDSFCCLTEPGEFKINIWNWLVTDFSLNWSYWWTNWLTINTNYFYINDSLYYCCDPAHMNDDSCKIVPDDCSCDRCYHSDLSGSDLYQCTCNSQYSSCWKYNPNDPICSPTPPNPYDNKCSVIYTNREDINHCQCFQQDKDDYYPLNSWNANCCRYANANHPSYYTYCPDWLYNYSHVKTPVQLTSDEILSWKVISLYTNNQIEDIICSTSSTCTNFSCEIITLNSPHNNRDYTIKSGNVTNLTQTGQTYFSGYEEITIRFNRESKIKINAFEDNPEDITEERNREDCHIDINDWIWTNLIDFKLKTNTWDYMVWLIGEETEYSKSLENALSEFNEYGWDEWFLFYISNPQRIIYWLQWWEDQEWQLWKIFYDIDFNSWVADEFYYIEWSSVINWYKNELWIKKPTYNFANPNSYLFNFPEY